MTRGMTENLGFLAARLHGRRSQMAEGGRLDALCHARALSQFASEALPGLESAPVTEIQSRIVQDLASEAIRIAAHLSRANAELLWWMAARFQVENIKTVLRSLASTAPPATMSSHLVRLPREFGMEADALAAVKSVKDLASLLPRGPVRQSLSETLALYGEGGSLFFLEAALDRNYFDRLLALTEALAEEDRELLKPLVLQEIDGFHLRLVARGRFIYRLEAAELLPFHVPGTRVSRQRFALMLADADVLASATRVLGRALDRLPRPAGDSANGGGGILAAELEALCWTRFLRLANRAFRRSHMGFAAVAAFMELRRVEAANLITASECIRAHLPAEEARARLIPRPALEVAHV